MSSGVQCSARQCKAASELSGARTKHQRLVGGFISECGSNAASTCSQCIMSRLVMEWDHSSHSAGTICTHMHRPQATCAHKNKHKHKQAISNFPQYTSNIRIMCCTQVVNLLASKHTPLSASPFLTYHPLSDPHIISYSDPNQHTHTHSFTLTHTHTHSLT